MSDPFGPSDPRCICHRRTVSLLHAALNGTDPPLCEIHQADELKQREVDAEVARLEDKRDGLAEVHEQLRDALSTPDELAARRDSKALADMDPMVRSLHLITNRGSNLPLNLPPEQYPAFQGWTTPGDAA